MEANRAIDRAILPDVSTTRDLSQALQLSIRTVQALIRGGVIPATKIAGRWYVERGQLLAVLRRRGGEIPGTGEGGSR